MAPRLKASNGIGAARARSVDARFSWTIAYAGQSPEVKQQIVDMAMNASGIRDTARVLHVSPTTVIQRTKKKAPELQQVNQAVLKHLHPEHVEVEICRADELAQRRGLTSELDEMWSYVGKKAEPRWLWHAIDHHSGTVLAYVFGRRKDAVFLATTSACWSRLVSPAFTPMGGAHTSGTSTQSSITWARRTRRKSRANTSTCGPGSSGSYVARFAFPKRRRCTIW